MQTTTLLGLVNNAALLVALGLLYDMIALKRHAERPPVQVLTGVIVGAVGIAVMMTPWEFIPGVIFDTRSVLLSVGGLFFGFVPTLVAVLMTGVFRLHLGGGGAWTGVAVIVTSGTIGVGWRHLRRKGLETVSSLELYILGIVVHMAMLLWMLSLPWSVAIDVLSKISLPVMAVYPVGTVLLGRLMTARFERRQAEDRLQKNQYYLTKAQELGVIGTWELDIQRNTLRWTDENYRIFGVPLGTEMNYELFLNCVHPDDRDHVQEKWRTGLDSEVFEVEHRLIVDDRVKWVREKADIEFDAEGNPIIAIGCTQDITDRMQGEEALRESEQRFRNYVETTQDLIWESDAEGKIIYLNPAWEQVTGFSLSELLGRSYLDFVAEGEVEGERAEFAQYPEGNDDGTPTTYISKNGSEIYLIFNTVPLYDAGKNIIGTLGSAFDITDRVHAEQSLRESEARYRGLFDNSPISLWEEDFSRVKELLDEVRSSGVSDLRAHLKACPDIVADCIQLVDIVDVNKATVDLFEAESKDEILGSLNKLFIDESLKVFREEFSALYEGNEAFESEIVGRSLRGNLIDCVVKVTIAPGYEDSWSKVLVSVTDITERKRAEEALRESKRRLEETLTELRETQEQMMHQERLASVGQLSAGIAHDFNNILASIVLYTQMSLHTSELTPTIRKRMEVIASEAERGADLVQQMLDFGRRAVLRRESLNLEPLLEKTVALLGRTLPESVRIEMAFEPGDYIINADPERVQQAIVNLALNAQIAMPDGGGLHIALSRVEGGVIDCVDCGRVVGGEWVQVEVRDTGTGIAPEVLPHIFEPFFTTRAPLGHGLGLAQVYGIVKQHGGHLEVETEVGLGTTFRLYWPALAVA
ncbi:MAG: PAS domain S-box protein, partial [Anaerolineae bacterium]|nr:PAS domain S-box protein [Anaerolineae bacterium]